MKLFTVGPVACYPDVLEAMDRQMVSHRSEEHVTMHYETVEQMQDILETKNPIYLFSSSARALQLETLAARMGNVAVRNAFGDEKLTINRNHFPRVVFTDP
jgi:aspartate aminotransferase-like enzyme